jgi:hypothetical protein
MVAGGLVLFQPVPDRMLPEAAVDVPLEDLTAAAAPWAASWPEPQLPHWYLYSKCRMGLVI